MLLESYNLLEGKNNELRDLRDKIRAKVKERKKENREFNILTKDVPVQKEFDQLGRAYDKIGLLVKPGVVPVGFLFDFYSKPISEAWQVLSPYYNKKKRKGPTRSYVKI
jgi:hypothetical protein